MIIFVCGHTVPCVTATKEDCYGTDKEDVGSKSLVDCEAECEDRRSLGQVCDAFSHKNSMFSKKCYLHTSPFTTLFPPETPDSAFNLYRVTCVWGRCLVCFCFVFSSSFNSLIQTLIGV